MLQASNTHSESPPEADGGKASPLLSIVSPTYNERANVRRLATAIEQTMGSRRWELIFVDDDSPDGTHQEVLALADEGLPVRCLRRIGRRGLSSAVIEGVMSARGDLIAVIDADMQHDETRLPYMMEILKTTNADIVVASRHAAGGSVGEWDAKRRQMSAFANWVSKLLIGVAVSDPMSGFFMARRAVFDGVVYDLSQQGYKILLDVLASTKERLNIVEVPYVFRDRTEGESKLDFMVVAEFGFLLIEKLTMGLVPGKFMLFSIVGAMGLLLHLAVLKTLKVEALSFLSAQEIATACAMLFNFVLNNAITYRSERLSGVKFVIGFFVFSAVCSFGALANLSVADLIMSQSHSWPLAGVAGAIMSLVFNFGVATKFVWERPRRRPRRQPQLLTQPLS